MSFEDFSQVEFLPINREAPGLVYIFFRVRGTDEMPFYVGQTKQIWGRLNDYYWAMSSASTDFRVGEAVRYLGSKGYRVLVKYKSSLEPRRDEATTLETLREHHVLLNDLDGFDYQKADESQERLKVHAFIDKHLDSSGLARST